MESREVAAYWAKRGKVLDSAEAVRRYWHPGPELPPEGEPMEVVPPPPPPPAGVVLGQDEWGEVVLLDRSRPQHVYLLGKTGMGKSAYAMMPLVLRDIAEGRGCCVIDPHATLVNNLLRRIPTAHAGRVYVLDFAGAWQQRRVPLGINLFDCNDHTDPTQQGVVAERFVLLIRKLFDSWGARMENILRNVGFVFAANPGENLASVPRFLSQEPFRRQLLRSVTNASVREYWLDDYPHIAPRETQPVLDRLRGFLTNELMYQVFSVPKTTFNVAEMLEERATFLVRLLDKEIGEQSVKLLGAVLVDEFLRAALARDEVPPGHPRQFHLYCDEFQEFATPATAKMFATVRKYGLGLVVAHQHRGQLQDENREATLGAANYLFFQTSAKDAREVGANLEHEFPERVLPHLPVGVAYAKLVGSVEGPVRLHAPTPPLYDEDHPLVVGIYQRSRERFGRPWSGRTPEPPPDPAGPAPEFYDAPPRPSNLRPSVRRVPSKD